MTRVSAIYGAGFRRTALVVLAVALMLLGGTVSQAATPPGTATPAPAASADVTLTAEPMLGGRVRPDTWAAVRVNVANDGPAISGELRLSLAAVRSGTTYSVAVELATGARQEHVLYAPAGVLSDRFRISLVSGATTLASSDVRVDASAAMTMGVYVVGEGAHVLVGPVRDAMTAAGRAAPTTVAVQPGELPPRVEAWATIDLLVWRDVDAEQLDAARLDALRAWVLTGGDLLVVGGSTGAATMRGLPADMLPYRPAEVVDVSVDDLRGLIGEVPGGAATLPVLVGPLERGVVLAGTEQRTMAARTPYGQGSVTLIGIDPATPSLVETQAAAALIERGLPDGLAPPLRSDDGSDDFIVSGLSNLPAVQLPRPDNLLLLILAYIVTLGPVNYLVLRRRDRREWAWLSMPLTIIAFAVGAYAFGIALKGANVIVNELAIVHGATGSDQGLGRVYVGVYSPRRDEFDVRIGGGALISPAMTSGFGGVSERPLDVVQGDPATARRYAIGFGALRALRAETVLPAPRVEADLQLVEGRLTGTLTNASGGPLDDVSVVYANTSQTLGDLAPGETRNVDLSTERNLRLPLSERLFPESVLAGPAVDATARRSVTARRAVVQHLAGGWQEWDGLPAGDGFAGGPKILAWASGARLPIDVGGGAERIGETLYLLSAPLVVRGPVVYSGSLLQARVGVTRAGEFFTEGSTASFYLSRGTAEVVYEPAGAIGGFTPSRLLVQLTAGRGGSPRNATAQLEPLPPAEQPDQDEPLSSDPRPDAGWGDGPRVQLWDRRSSKWVEFEPLELGSAYEIRDPGRYVDGVGAFRVRFVARGFDYVEFGFGARLEGTVP